MEGIISTHELSSVVVSVVPVHIKDELVQSSVRINLNEVIVYI